MKRVNPDRLLRAAELGQPVRDVIGRGTGKTTASILRALAAAHESPGSHQPILDPDLFPNQYAEVARICSTDRARHVVAAARDIVQRLGLKRVSVATDRHSNMPVITSTFAVDIYE